MGRVVLRKETGPLRSRNITKGRVWGWQLLSSWPADFPWRHLAGRSRKGMLGYGASSLAIFKRKELNHGTKETIRLLEGTVLASTHNFCKRSHITVKHAKCHLHRTYIASFLSANLSVFSTYPQLPEVELYWIIVHHREKTGFHSSSSSQHPPAEGLDWPVHCLQVPWHLLGVQVDKNVVEIQRGAENHLQQANRERYLHEAEI